MSGVTQKKHLSHRKHLSPRVTLARVATKIIQIQIQMVMKTIQMLAVSNDLEIDEDNDACFFLDQFITQGSKLNTNPVNNKSSHKCSLSVVVA